MKRELKLLKAITVFSLVATIFISCDKDETVPAQPYVGNWESKEYVSLDLVTGNPVMQKMTFTFTNTTFEDRITQKDMQSPGELEFLSAIKGKITEPTTTAMNIEINQLSLSEGLWFNKETDPENFDNAWNSTLGLMLHEQFTAKYIIDGDKMQLILPVKIGATETTDTLNLTKM